MLKTLKNKASVTKFLQGNEDCLKLVKIFTEVTKEKPMMWGKTIIGFGSYHYKSKSGQEGDWPLTGFSPRKQNISIYIMPGFRDYQGILKKLGKHKVSGGCCLYIKQLSDINVTVLKKLIRESVKDMKIKHSV